MRSVGVSTSVPASKGSAELNHHKRKELKEVRDGGVFDGRRLSEEDESRINEDVNSNRQIELVVPKVAVQRQHPQPQGPLVQWERFLPLRSLKVLLVEDDDCTRHVVGALLRNCSYEVTAVANGLEAWKVLIDLNKQIDLVLTEVVMPYLSGVGLLTKIMNHIPRKNIPVIMMSSDDSMGIVFNCLSKGAVDFLVKPIRKNELKNLWQHVWRKCHSSSGSESESGIHAHKPTHVRSNEVSDDDTDEDDDISIGLTIKDGSDNGSGTQSSWSRRAVEVESAKYTWDRLKGPPDSTCAQVNHVKPDTVGTGKHSEEDDEIDAVGMGKDLEIGVSGNSEKNMDLSMKESGEPRTMSANDVTIAKLDSTESPALELSLKRPRDLEDPDTSTHKRNVVRQSDLSAFSRYNNNTSNANQAPTGNAGSCSPVDVTISSEAAKPVNIQSNSTGAPNQRSNGSSTHNNDMGSSTNNAFSKPEPLADDKAIPPSLSEGDKSQFQVQHHHHHYHHHHHHVHKTQQQPTANQDDDGSSRNMVFNDLDAPDEGIAANYGSASGSNNKSNGENGRGGQKGNSYVAIAEGGDKGVAEKGKSGNVSGSGSGSGRGSGVDQDRLAQREAALVKFRQKRKERCFEKKVRYQSRKKLAEQRPRVRGQFVRQGVNGKEASS